MAKRIDEAKGRTKKAAGDLTDDEKLRREGKVDRAVSNVKERIDDAADTVSDRVDRAAEKVKQKVGRGGESRD